MKSENDILAEYIREYHPDIPKSIEFQCYRLARAFIEFGNAIGSVFEKLTAPREEIIDEGTV